MLKLKENGFMLALMLVMICIVLGAFGQISMKQGMTLVGNVFEGQESWLTKGWKTFTNPFVLLGICLYGVSLVLWLMALSKLDVSFMYPLLSLGYLLTAILAFVFLKETVTLVRWTGIILVVVGSWLILRT